MSIRVPGALALLLVVPVLLLAGLLALAGLMAGVAALVLMPRLQRRHPRAAEEETTITLDPTAYRRADDDARAVGRLLAGPQESTRGARAGGHAREHGSRRDTHGPKR